MSNTKLWEVLTVSQHFAGTCWGTYPVLKLSAYPEFVAGVGMHPSHSPISGLVGEDETKLLEGAKSAQILFMPAGDDHENVRAGGLAEKVRSSPGCQSFS